MENELAVVAFTYVGIRLSIVAVLAYGLYKAATYRKPIRAEVASNRIRNERT